MRGNLFALIAAFGLVAAPVAAVTWDTDDDGTINPEEFAEGNATASEFDRFDDNNDNVLTPDEVGLGEPDEAFGSLDTDRDGVLRRRELDLGLFGSYDLDGDRMLDVNELMDSQQDGKSAYERVFGREPNRPTR